MTLDLDELERLEREASPGWPSAQRFIVALREAAPRLIEFVRAVHRYRTVDVAPEATASDYTLAEAQVDRLLATFLPTPAEERSNG